MQVGDVVELGPHRLVCGDAFNPEHVDLLMQGEKADMLYCDPPYGMKLETKRTTWGHARPGMERPSLASGEVDRRDYPAVIGDDAAFDPAPLIHAFRTAPEQFWWGADYYRASLPPDGSWVVWDKKQAGGLDKSFGSGFELCWSRKKHKREIARVIWCGLLGQNGIDQHRHHPTQKPVKLAEWFLDRYSKEGAIVVDLFGGSGSTLLACERKNRVCRMAELSPQYCDVIIQRYEQMTQQPALIA